MKRTAGLSSNVPVPTRQGPWGDAQPIQRRKGCRTQPVHQRPSLETAPRCLDRQRKSSNPSLTPAGTSERHVFHQWNRRKTAGFFEHLPPNGVGLIAVRKSESKRAKINQTHPEPGQGPRLIVAGLGVEAKVGESHHRIGQGLAGSLTPSLGKTAVRMEEKQIRRRCGSRPTIQLDSAAPRPGKNSNAREVHRPRRRPIVASPIDHDDLGSLRPH